MSEVNHNHRRTVISMSAVIVVLLIITILSVLSPSNDKPERHRDSEERSIHPGDYTYNGALQGFTMEKSNGFKAEYRFDRLNWYVLVIRVEGKRFLIIKDGNAMTSQPMPDEFKETGWDGELKPRRRVRSE